WGDFLVVRDAGGQAGGGGLVRARQFQRPGDLAHVRLGGAGLGQRAQHLVVGGGAGARPVGTFGVIGVLPVGHRDQAVLGDHLIGDPAEELVLAEEAAVHIICPVGGVVLFVGGHLHHAVIDHRSHVLGGA